MPSKFLCQDSCPSVPPPGPHLECFPHRHMPLRLALYFLGISIQQHVSARFAVTFPLFNSHSPWPQQPFLSTSLLMSPTVCLHLVHWGSLGFTADCCRNVFLTRSEQKLGEGKGFISCVTDDHSGLCEWTISLCHLTKKTHICLQEGTSINALPSFLVTEESYRT